MVIEDYITVKQLKISQIEKEYQKRIGGTMPEDLPTPNKSAKLIEKEKNRNLNAQNKKMNK